MVRFQVERNFFNKDLKFEFNTFCIILSHEKNSSLSLSNAQPLFSDNFIGATLLEFIGLQKLNTKKRFLY